MFGLYDINDCSILNYKDRLDIYKKCGFKEIALYLDERYQVNGENYLDIISYARQIGLKIEQVHIDWKISNLICDDSTNEYFEYVSKKLYEASMLQIKYVVAHASQSNNPPIISVSQLNKFKSMMEKQPVTVILCLENVRNNDNLNKILNLNLPNVKMCFDLGHAHCYDNENTLFETYKDKIVCSHLHNNFGSDSHNILTEGEIDYIPFLKNLNKIPNSSNCLECFPPRNSNYNRNEFEEFIEKCYDSVNLEM